MAVSTKFVFLMHPKEFKQEKAGTGRLTHLALENSEIVMGICFDDDVRVNALLSDERYHCVLLYPGPTAKNVSEGELRALELSGKTLVVFLLDATWSCAKKMIKLSTKLQAIPRLMFTPTSKSRFVIKQQPNELCLSTLEATHELLLALDRFGIDRYDDPHQLLNVFDEMQRFQIDRARNAGPSSYRSKPYSDPADRKPTRQKRRAQRSLFFRGTT